MMNLFKKKLPKQLAVWGIGIPYDKVTFDKCFSSEDSDFIDSLEYLYSTTDKDILWSHYEAIADNINSAIKDLKNRGVYIKPIFSLDDLSECFMYPIVILTSHRHRFLPCLDFMGNNYSITEIINNLPDSFDGTFDISSCYSTSFERSCKRKMPFSTIIAAGSESSVDLRLFLYKSVFKYMTTHHGKSYVDSLRIVMRRIIHREQEKSKKSNVFLGGKIRTLTKGTFASVFAPKNIIKGDGMLVQVYIYNIDKREIEIKAKKVDNETEERDTSKLEFKPKKGDRISVCLNVLNATIPCQVKEFTWLEKVSKAIFFVDLPNTINNKKILIQTVISVNNAMVGELAFSTNVTQISNNKEYAQIESTNFNKVFISYSHEDEEKVRFIANAYEAVHIDHFFDRSYLKGGDIYPMKIQNYINSADLFILCWSANASKSIYVEKERKQALERAYPQIDIKNAKLKIYPISFEPLAELPKDMIDIYNFVEIKGK